MTAENPMRYLRNFFFPAILIMPFNPFPTPSAISPMAPVAEDAEAKKFLPVSEKAVLYAFRGRGRDSKHFELCIDSQASIKTTEYSYVRFELAPGEHEIAAKFERESKLKVYMAAGQIYFVQLDWYRIPGGLGLPQHKLRLELLPEEDGRAGVMRCKLLAKSSEAVQ